MSRITSFFSKATPDQIKEQDRRGLEQIRHDKRWKEAQEESTVADRAQHKREGAAERQRNYRNRIRKVEAAEGRRDPVTLRLIKPMNLVPSTPSKRSLDASIEPDDQSRSQTPNKKCRASPVNYFEPVRFTLIKRAVKFTGYSSAEAIVKELKKGPNGDLFRTLQRGTVSHWLNANRTGWTDEVLARAELAAEAQKNCITPRVASKGKKLGRPARLDPYPMILRNIVELLTNIRHAGCVITRSIAQGVTLAFIRADAPELFHDPRFKCSDAFIRRILRNELNWSWRATTQTACKLPANWDDQCIDLAHRLTWNIQLHRIPPELIINADQTGVSYLGPGSKTWELKGSNQVSAVGQEEKRQFTLMVAVTAAGQLLPYQVIYKGRTTSSLPSAQAQLLSEALKFIYTAGGDKHWSSLESMIIWVLEVLSPFIERERQRLKLSHRQKAILILDCWSVHRGEPFRKWLKSTFPWLIVLYVPGGCTSVAQPCDTGINRPLKHKIKSSCIEWLSETTQKQLRRGIEPQKVVIDSTPSTLRNASVGWLVNSWEWLRDHPQVILDAWRHAAFKGWNLSYEFLSSVSSRDAVEDRCSEDRPFALSLIEGVYGSAIDSEFEEEDTPEYDDDYAVDTLLLGRIKHTCTDLPKHVAEVHSDLMYTGDEELTDSELEDD